MTIRARRRQEALRHWLNFATGLAIGLAIWMPVLAASGIDPSGWSAQLARGDWSTLLMVVSVVLLGAGLLLRLRAQHAVPPPRVESEDAIGRYRPRIQRP